MDMVCTLLEMPPIRVVIQEGQVVVVQCTLPGFWWESIVKDVLASSSLTPKTSAGSTFYTIR